MIPILCKPAGDNERGGSRSTEALQRSNYSCSQGNGNDQALAPSGTASHVVCHRNGCPLGQPHHGKEPLHLAGMVNIAAAANLRDISFAREVLHAHGLLKAT